MLLPVLAASDWGLAVAIFVLLLVFVAVSWFIIQATRAQLHWRTRAEAGDVEVIRMLVEDEVNRWKTMKMPKGYDPGTWRGVQSVELLEVTPGGVRVSATAESRYAMMEGERREISGSFREALKVTAKLADMLMYDVPNVRLQEARIDVYTTWRDEQGPGQRCILSTTCTREVSATLDWDELEPEEIVRAFSGRYRLDDRGEAMPIEVEAVRTSVPAVFYKDD